MKLGSDRNRLENKTILKFRKTVGTSFKKLMKDERKDLIYMNG